MTGANSTAKKQKNPMIEDNMVCLHCKLTKVDYYFFKSNPQDK